MARRTVVFKLVVWYGPHRYAHGLVYIGVAPATTPATGVTTTTTPCANTPPTPSPSMGRGPAPVTATTVPASGGNPPTRVVHTDNWAGYGVEGTAPYNGVRGAFNIPLLTTGDSATDHMDVWVGIDGIEGTAGANDLIQDGVMESMVPCQGNLPYDPSAYTGILSGFVPGP
jgi:hypothetical protein